MQAIYRASQAGVKIDLICRGICALRPGIPGLSENVRVISVVDRFLEHSRIFYFGNAGDPLVYIGSADWMDRNLSRRVEVVFPIEPAELKQRLIHEILEVSLSDNAKAREMQPDGTYKRLKLKPGEPIDSQPGAIPRTGADQCSPTRSGHRRQRPPSGEREASAPAQEAGEGPAVTSSVHALVDFSSQQLRLRAVPRRIARRLLGAFGDRKSGMVSFVRRGRNRNSTGHSVTRRILT